MEKRLKNFDISADIRKHTFESEFWYNEDPKKRFEGFERQRFSSKLTNQLREFFLENKGVSQEEYSKVHQVLGTVGRRQPP